MSKKLNEKQRYKLKWAFVGIGLCLLFLSGVAVLVCGLHFGWDAVKKQANVAWNWLNQPLPIVSISVVTICSFALTIFVKSNWGKKNIEKVKEYAELTRQKNDEFSKEMEGHLNELKETLKTYELALCELEVKIKAVCETSRNKNVKALADKDFVKQAEEYFKQLHPETMKEQDNGKETERQD